MTTNYLTESVALQFPENTNDGFARPKLGWSALDPTHLHGMGGDCMTSNVWIGEPAQMFGFIEKLAAEYASKEHVFSDGEEYEGISLGYWEHNGLAMVGEFCTGDTFFEQMSESLSEEAAQFKMILCDGNDNSAGNVLDNEDLDAETRITLAPLAGAMPCFNNGMISKDHIILRNIPADGAIKHLAQ